MLLYEKSQGNTCAFRTPSVNWSTSNSSGAPTANDVQGCNSLESCCVVSGHVLYRTQKTSYRAMPSSVSQHHPRQHTSARPSSAAAFKPSKLKGMAREPTEDRGGMADFLGPHGNLQPPTSHLQMYHDRIVTIAMTVEPQTR